MNRQKEIELWFLEAARKINSSIPDGTIEDFEKPDCKIHTANGLLGVEVTEILRAGIGPIRPIALEAVHQEIIRLGEDEYYSKPDAIPVQVRVYWWNPGDERIDKQRMVRGLVDFVRAHAEEAKPVETFSRLSVPEGFGVISISSERGQWYSGECGGINGVGEIFDQLASRISAKNEFMSDYRLRLPNAPIWLLVYSGCAVSRGLPMPHGIEDWKHPSDFDKVLFYSQLSGQVVEIQRP